MQHCAFVVPAVLWSFAMSVPSQVNFVARPPHFVVSYSQQLEGQEAASPVHFVVLSEVFSFIPLPHTAFAHVATFVQQLVIMAAPVPLSVPFLVASWYFPVPQATVLPPHFAVSASQQLVGQEAAFIGHFVALTEAFRFVPALHAATAHVALSVQQAAVMAAAVDPLTMPFLVASLYFALPQVTVAPRHFVVSASQQFGQVEVLGVALAHFKVVSVALNFIPAMHVPAALQAPTDSAITRATIFLEPSFINQSVMCHRGEETSGRCDVTPHYTQTHTTLSGQAPAACKYKAFGHQQSMKNHGF